MKKSDQQTIISFEFVFEHRRHNTQNIYAAILKKLVNLEYRIAIVVNIESITNVILIYNILFCFRVIAMAIVRNVYC